MVEKKIYQVRVTRQLVPVTEEIYLTYYCMKRRELYLRENDAKHGVVFYISLYTDGTNGEDGLPDNSTLKVECIVTDKFMHQL